MLWIEVTQMIVIAMLLSIVIAALVGVFVGGFHLASELIHPPNSEAEHQLNRKVLIKSILRLWLWWLGVGTVGVVIHLLCYLTHSF